MSIETLRSIVTEYDAIVAERNRLRADIGRIAEALNLSEGCIPSAFLVALPTSGTMVDVILDVLAEAKINAHDLNEARKKRGKR